MKTFLAKKETVQPKWHLIDADGVVLGRLAVKAANLIRGRHKASYTPSVDTGDFVVVVNCDRLRVTGKKLEQKTYYRHSGYPGGLRERTLEEQMERDSTEVLRHAVRGMLPKNKIGSAQITMLKAYAGPDHPHAAQEPKPF